MFIIIIIIITIITNNCHALSPSGSLGRLLAETNSWNLHTVHSNRGGSVAEWLACWTQAQKGPVTNRSRDAVG